jgi:general L-amino acid transport system permease protein
MDPARGAKLSTWLNDQRVRGRIYQTLLLACVAALACGAIYNAVTNMQARGMPTGFGFWNEVAGFDINLHLISYTNLSTYGRAFWVGLLNTLLIAVICIPLATLLGFAIGVTRLSPNWLHQHSAQHPAASPVALLVQRGPEIPTGPSTVDQHRRCRISR